MHTRLHLAAAALLTAATAISPAAAQDTKRELGAHVHGQGALDIALDGSKLVVELRAPGADVVGFEGTAKTAAAKRAVTAALSALEKPQTLFVLPDAAQCSVVKAKAENHIEDNNAKAQAAKSAPAKHAHGGHSHDSHAKDAHSEFHADYEFACAKPELLTAIDIAFFKAFPKSQKLAVQIISTKGQTAIDATPAKPRLDLSALLK